MAAVTVLVFVWYFVTVLSDAATTPVSEIEYRGPLLMMMGVFVVLLIANHIVVALVSAAAGAVKVGQGPTGEGRVDSADPGSLGDSLRSS